MERYGEVPSAPVIFAACDDVYFKKFAPAFVSSISKNTDKNVHIHVMNPSEESIALACYLNAMCEQDVTYTFQDSDLSQYSEQQKRALYASLRFMVAPFILSHAKKILILDIDCLVMDNVSFPTEAVGFFPRESLANTVGWEAEGTKVAAGCVYFDERAMNVCDAVCETLGGLPLQWFNDQISLNHVFSQIPSNLSHKYDEKFMDWEFVEGSTIWTGKGPRKYENDKYVNEQKMYHDAIMKNVATKVILSPRLDIPFKRFGVSIKNSVNEPIREHWKAFSDLMCQKGFLKVEAPRWMFNESIEQYFDGCDILVPHVERHNWGGGENTKFYMQTVFPWLFTVDPKGWAGGAQYIDTFDSNAEYSEDAFAEMQKYIKSGSKFQHLQSNTTDWGTIDKGYYIIVPLQLPHDETIKYHSDFSVEEFVTRICQWVADNEDAPEVVFKGHPVNLKSMEPLKQIIDKFRSDGNQRIKDSLTYIDKGNFHELVKESIGMFVLNGGSGQEAMLMQKPVVSFGHCDYAPAVINGDIENVDDAYQQMIFDDEDERLAMYKRWYDWYVNKICLSVK